MTASATTHFLCWLSQVANGSTLVMCRRNPSCVRIVQSAQIPLIVDHIDGNYRNILDTNLRLICPNCDAQLSTYKGRNRGRGRGRGWGRGRCLDRGRGRGRGRGLDRGVAVGVSIVVDLNAANDTPESYLIK